MSQLNIPNSFTTGTTINAAPFNGNDAAIQAAVNNIDYTNIGAAGLFASNLLPGTGAQATFGGSLLYTFPAGVAAGGPLTATTVSGTTGTFSGAVIAGGTAYVPPVYTASGAALASTTHAVLLAGNTATFAGASSTTVSIALSGAAIFGSANYFVQCFVTGTTGSVPNGLIFAGTGLATNSINLIVYTSNLTVATGTATFTVFAIGA
jgi:hypothetical protein